MRIIDKLIEEVVKTNPNKEWEKEEIVQVANMYLKTFVEFEKGFLDGIKEKYKLKAKTYTKENNMLRECIYATLSDSMETLKNQIEEHYEYFIKGHEEK